MEKNGRQEYLMCRGTNYDNNKYEHNFNTLMSGGQNMLLKHGSLWSDGISRINDIDTNLLCKIPLEIMFVTSNWLHFLLSDPITSETRQSAKNEGRSWLYRIYENKMKYLLQKRMVAICSSEYCFQHYILKLHIILYFQILEPPPFI